MELWSAPRCFLGQENEVLFLLAAAMEHQSTEGVA